MWEVLGPSYCGAAASNCSLGHQHYPTATTPCVCSQRPGRRRPRCQRVLAALPTLAFAVRCTGARRWPRDQLTGNPASPHPLVTPPSLCFVWDCTLTTRVASSRILGKLPARLHRQILGPCSSACSRLLPSGTCTCSIRRVVLCWTLQAMHAKPTSRCKVEEQLCFLLVAIAVCSQHE